MLECGGGWIAHWMDRLDEFTESYGWQLLGLDAEAVGVLPPPGLRLVRSRRAHHGRARAARRRGHDDLGVGLPAQRRPLSRRRRRAARAHGGHGVRRRARASSARTRCASTASTRARRADDQSSTSCIRGGRVVDGTGMPAFTRRRRGARRAHRAHRARDGAAARDDRRRRLRRDAGLHRRAHALRRAARLGSDRVAVVLARRHDGARPATAASRSRPRSPRTSTGSRRCCRASRACRREALGAGLPLSRRQLRRLLARARRPLARQRRRLRRPLRRAPLRHGRRRLGARRATPDEIAAMQELVRQAMREGAIGFSTSQLDIHVGARRPRGAVEPRRAARRSSRSPSVLAEFDHGAIEIIPRSFVEGYDEADRELLLEHVPRLGPADRAEHPRADAAPDGLAARARLLPRGVPRRACACTRSSPTNELGAHLSSLDTRSSSTRCRPGARC